MNWSVFWAADVRLNSFDGTHLAWGGFWLDVVSGGQMFWAWFDWGIESEMY